jgi:hypothetical protein
MPLDAGKDVQSAISRLLEDESLTEALDDSPAQVLLNWGVERLEQGHEGPAIRRLVRRLGGLVRDRDSLTAQEALQRLDSALGSSRLGIAAIEAELVGLWQERGALPQVEWTEQLTRLANRLLHPPGDSAVDSVEGVSDLAEEPVPASSHAPSAPSAVLDSADPSPGSRPSKAGRPGAPWWQFWRRR